MFFEILIALPSLAQEEPDHSGFNLDCAGDLGVTPSTNDWYDCPYPGDIMHCEGFVEIGSNLSPTNKLEVSHGDGEYERQGIALNNTRSDGIRTSEIYFRHQNREQWALGNDFFADGKHNFFLWDHLNEITRLFFTGDDLDATRLGVNNNTNPIATLDVNGEIRSATLAAAPSNYIVQANNSGILTNVPISNFSANLNYWTLGGTDVYRPSGKVGIGSSTFSSGADLEVTGKISSSFLGAGSGKLVQTDANGILTNTSIASLLPSLNYWTLGSNGSDLFRNTRVFIGMNSCPSCTTYTLYVAGGMIANEVRVTAPTNPFPDFVFDKKYKLQSLTDLEKYVTENKHLPHIPGAKEIESNNGYELGEMQRKLLQTVEEQTLYIIDLQKQLNQLKADMSDLKK